MDDTTTDRRIVVSGTTALADAFRESTGKSPVCLQEFVDDIVDIIKLLEYLTQKVFKERIKKVGGKYPLGYSYSEYYGNVQYGDWAGGYVYVRKENDDLHEKNTLDLSLEQLTERLQAACVSASNLPSFMEGKTLGLSHCVSLGLFPGNSLFECLSVILGFYNFLPGVGVESEKSSMVFCLNVFRNLYETAELTDGELKSLSQAAAERVSNRLRYQYNDLGGHLSLPEYMWVGMRKYEYFPQYCHAYYQKAYSLDDISSTGPLVSRIVRGEEKRLRKFCEALHGTLQALAAVAALRNEMPPPEDMLGFLRAVHAVLTGQADASVLLGDFHLERQEETADADLLAASQRIEELEKQLALLKSQGGDESHAVPPSSSDRRVRIVQETHDSVLHMHHYFIEINDQANGVLQPIKVDFAVDDEGTIIPPPEEEEA